MAQENEPREGQAPSGAAQEGETTPENTRVKVRGRIGSSFDFRTSKDKGIPIARFSIAEHPDASDPDKTVWHNGVMFKDHALALQKRVEAGELRTGMEVDVVGFVHHQEVARREGGTRMIEQIYAVSIKPVVKPHAPQASEAPQGPQGQ